MAPRSPRRPRVPWASALTLVALTACSVSDVTVLGTFSPGQGGHPLGGQAGVGGFAGAQGPAGDSSSGGQTHAGTGVTDEPGGQGGTGVVAGLGGVGGTVSGYSGYGGAGSAGGAAGSVSGGTGGAGEPGGAGQGGTLAQQASLVSLSNLHTCAHLAGGGVKCWGLNNQGQLGLGDKTSRGEVSGQMGASLPVVSLGTGVKATGVTVLGGASCALLADGQAKCWGGGVYGDQPGEMGDVLPFLKLGTGALVTQLVAGDAFACALLASGQVKCWGDNFHGQLGLGSVVTWGNKAAELGDNLPALDLGAGLTVKSLAAGAMHTCALFEGGRVKCWGDNSAGELGLGDTTDRGNGAGEMGSKLPFVDLGTGVKATAVVASLDASCALIEGGKVKCWGNNLFGQLGLGDTSNRGDGKNEMGDSLPFIDLGANSKVVDLAAASYSMCALLDDGRVKCWGHNSSGQLGQGDTQNRGDQAGEMGNALAAVDLGVGVGAAHVYGGSASWCALLTGGQLKCWGDNSSGQLGLGDTDSRGSKTGQMGAALPFVDLGATISP